MNAEEFWPPGSCDCKSYSKSPQKTKKVWDRVKKLCRAKNRRGLEIQRLKLRAQQKIKAGKKPEALVILREMKRLKDMKLTDYIAEKESAKLARVGANSGGRRRRRRSRQRRRTRRGRGKGTDKFGRQLGTKKKRDKDVYTRRRPTVARIQAAYEANLRSRWGVAVAESRAEAKTKAFTKEMETLGLGLKNLTFTRGRKSPKSSPKSSKRKSIKKRGGRRRTRRRRGGMKPSASPKTPRPPKRTVSEVEKVNEENLRRKWALAAQQQTAEREKQDKIKKILKETAQKEVAAAAKRILEADAKAGLQVLGD